VDRRRTNAARGKDRTGRAIRILIRGGGFVNRGAEAMLRTVQTELDRRLANVTCFVTDRAVEPGSESLVAAAGLNTLGRCGFSRGKGLAHTLSRMRAEPGRARRIYATRHDWLPALSEVERVDAVVDINGYAYGDPWGRAPAVAARDYVAFARQSNKPYIFMPQAWGPFEDSRSRPHYRELCERAALLFARDQTSRSHLADLLGRSAAEFELRPDIAFRFCAERPEVGRALLADLGLDARTFPLVGIAPNRQMYRRMPGTGMENEYVRALVEICGSVRARGAAVVLIPHEIEPTDSGTTDDRLLCSMVACGAGDPQVVALAGRCDAAQIKAVIGQLALLIGSRFHALVAALSCRVPVVALGWSHKYAELLRPFDMNEYVLNGEQISGADLGELVGEAFEKRDELRARLAERLPAIERSVDETFDRVCAVILGAAH
jgi:polysaccharide pyruvyl transferase WcaK-like protein